MTTHVALRRAFIALIAFGGALLAAASIAAAPSARSAAVAPLTLSVVPATMACEALRSVDISAAVGARTRVEAAAPVTERSVAPYCRANVVVDDYARFELRLPVSDWNQRLLFGGGPGAQATSTVKLDRFATVSWQDLGRRGNEDVFAHNAQYRINAGYRGMHLQVLAAKALIARYFGRGPRFSYYNACSNPGREGMIEAERFPQDFDGTGAGCPPINATLNNGLFYAWNVRANTAPDGSYILTADTLPILHQAVLDQCDAADGLKDGIVSAPFACHPSFDSILCRPGSVPGKCLTAAQIHVAEELYRGVHDADGTRLAPSGLLPGSELAWTATIAPGAPFGGPAEAGPMTSSALRSQYSYPALPATWTIPDVKFDRATFAATTKLHGVFDGTNPDLAAYAKAGHKLILWMALADTNVLPTQAILYYAAVRERLGAAATDRFARFYVLPGVYHCGGGDGAMLGDLLLPLMLWVERGIAPTALPGAHAPRDPHGPPQGAGPPTAAPLPPDLTRPIYPYPYTAQYGGHGDIRDAASFVRGPARPAPIAQLSDWLGKDFYRPESMKWCTAGSDGLDCTSRKP